MCTINLASAIVLEILDDDYAVTVLYCLKGKTRYVCETRMPPAATKSKFLGFIF